MQPYFHVDQIQCPIGDATALRDLSFTLQQGEIGCLLGPSGCGKTSLLRLIAGFINPTQGCVHLDQRQIAHASGGLAPEKRGVGMVFQDYALFPHMTVAENIEFGLFRKSRKSRREQRDELLNFIRLDGLANRFPHELSGGQQQRVALARAMAVQPKLLLLDEPFSGLDTELRRDLSLKVRETLKSQNITALLVTHDQEEAFATADKVGVMRDGKLLQWDAPYALYHKPKDAFVADFIGRGVFISGRVSQPCAVSTELGTLTGHCSTQPEVGTQVDVLLRPDDLVYDLDGPNQSTIVSKLFMGTNTHYSLKLPSGHIVESVLPSHQDMCVGANFPFRVETTHLILFASIPPTS